MTFVDLFFGSYLAVDVMFCNNFFFFNLLVKVGFFVLYNYL